MSEPDETDAGDACSIDELRLERLGEDSRQDVCVDTEVDENPALSS